MSASPPDRCRIVLVAPPGADPAALPRRIAEALSGGDVASLVLPQYDLDETAFQKLVERIAPHAQEQGVAVIVAGDSRVAGRIGADGVHVEGGADAVRDAVARAKGRLMVGTGGVKTRDEALDLGEAQPDYVYFGRFGYDTKPGPHPRNLELARWWSEMIALPCIVEAGSDIESVDAAAATGAEFVGLSSAVFSGSLAPAEAVAEANRRLDAAAPHFTE